jgi:hypothetical protein
MSNEKKCGYGVHRSQENVLVRTKASDAPTIFYFCRVTPFQVFCPLMERVFVYHTKLIADSHNVGDMPLQVPLVVLMYHIDQPEVT